MKVVASCGFGVQTVAMCREIIAGRLSRPDLAVFADTQNEPAPVYAARDREFAVLREHGIECVTATKGDLMFHVLTHPLQSHLPLFTIDLNTGAQGVMIQGCSRDFKARVVARECRRRGWHREGVEMWLGITTDEITRVKPNPTPWITNRWPLIEADMRRSDCEAVLNRLGLPIVKSACIFCPFRRAGGWRALSPLEREKVIIFDEWLRDRVRPGQLRAYLCDQRRPMREVFADLDDQPSLFIDADQVCDSGACFA